MNAKQITAIVGSIALALGCFLPVIHLPIVGDFTFFNNGSGDGLIVLILAFVALACAFFRPAIIVSAIMGWLSAGFVAFSFYHYLQQVSKVQTRFGDNILGQFFTHSVQLGAAWPFLIGGTIALIVSGFLPAQKEQALQPAPVPTVAVAKPEPQSETVTPQQEKTGKLTPPGIILIVAVVIIIIVIASSMGIR
jgi:hypothetical protein